jgi:hypothetical protein
VTGRRPGGFRTGEEMSFAFTITDVDAPVADFFHH